MVGKGGEAAIRGEQNVLGAEQAMARRARVTISSTLSTRSCFRFTTPTPTRVVDGSAFKTSIAPARSVQSSRKSVPTPTRSSRGRRGR